MTRKTTQHPSLAVERRDHEGNLIDDAGRLRVKHSWRGGPLGQSMYPEQLFKPESRSDGGSLEAARDAADKANERLGVLLAKLYEKKVLTAQECLEVADSTEWEILK